MKPVFAIDVGGVLASKQHDGVPVEGSLEAVEFLDKHFDLYVVSQCGRNRALMTREWLREWKFPIPELKQIYIPFSETKIPALHQIRARYFIDDRWKHVKPALRLPAIRMVFHLDPEGLSHADNFQKYVLVKSWEAVQGYMLGEI